MQTVSRLKAWLSQPAEQTQMQQKRAERHYEPGAVAYYWDGSAPVPREIRDISLTGAYLKTPERWYPGTIVKIVLRRNREGFDAPGESIEVCCRVVRQGIDGVGLQFISLEVNKRMGLQRFIADLIESLRDKSNGTNSSTRGQALIEFAFVVPVLFLMMVAAMDFGGFIYAWITVANATRAGAQYAILGASSAGRPGTPTTSAVQSVITAAASSLPSSVSVCVNTNATANSKSGTCSGFSISSIPADPEAPSYALTAVDVKYTYSPFFSSFGFPALGISLPSFPSTIHMRTVMRVLN